MDKARTFKKIVYFDKETIGNILQQRHGGAYSSAESKASGGRFEGDIGVNSEVSLWIPAPFLARLKFLFTGSISASFVRESNSLVTVTSTEIGQFEEIKPELVHIERVLLKEIKNSLTAFRMAAGFLNVLRDGVENVKSRELVDLLDDAEGYSVYEVPEDRYVRFNTQAFLSNYKYNDVLHSRLELYCVKAGDFTVDDFDYLKQIQGMQDLFETNQLSNVTLADLFPGPTEDALQNPRVNPLCHDGRKGRVALYDAICAYLSEG